MLRRILQHIQQLYFLLPNSLFTPCDSVLFLCESWKTNDTLPRFKSIEFDGFKWDQSCLNNTAFDMIIVFEMGSILYGKQQYTRLPYMGSIRFRKREPLRKKPTQVETFAAGRPDMHFTNTAGSRAPRAVGKRPWRATCVEGAVEGRELCPRTARCGGFVNDSLGYW